MKSKYALPKDGGLITTGVPRDIYCRYEKIPTRIFETEYAGVQHVADQVVSAINAHEGAEPFLLGLTTGKTPLGLYRELVERYKAGKVSFKNVAVVSLDEFYPIAPTISRAATIVFAKNCSTISISPRITFIFPMLQYQ